MANPVQLLVDGKATGVWRYEADKPTADKYMLPTSRMGDSKVICVDAKQAVATGIFAENIYKAGGVRAITFTTAHGKDAVRVDYMMAAYRTANQPKVEKVLTDFVADAQNLPGLALVNKGMSFSEKEFEESVHRFLKEEKHPIKAAVRALVERFNACVAIPDGGEVVYRDVRREDGIRVEPGKTVSGEVLYVDMIQKCTSCASQPITLNVKLLPFISGYLSRIIAVRPAGPNFN